jgi:hypothetical protein
MSKLREAIEMASQDNLCTYFILPLCLVNKLRFGGAENFLSSYLSNDGSAIYVEVKHQVLLEDELPEHEIIEQDERIFYKFKISPAWAIDVKLFMEGKYTRMSERAKRLIREGSTLEFRGYRGTVPFTDFRLLALSNSATVRAMWEDLIFDEIDIARKYELGDELLSIPSEKSYISFPLPEHP